MSCCFSKLWQVINVLCPEPWHGWMLRFDCTEPTSQTGWMIMFECTELLSTILVLWAMLCYQFGNVKV